MNCWVVFCCRPTKGGAKVKNNRQAAVTFCGCLTGNKSSIIKEIPEMTSFVCNRNDHLPHFLFAAEGIHGFSCTPVMLDGPETELQQFSAFSGFQLCITASTLPTHVSHCCLKLKINTTCMYKVSSICWSYSQLIAHVAFPAAVIEVDMQDIMCRWYTQ